MPVPKWLPTLLFSSCSELQRHVVDQLHRSNCYDYLTTPLSVQFKHYLLIMVSTVQGHHGCLVPWMINWNKFDDPPTSHLQPSLSPCFNLAKAVFHSQMTARLQTFLSTQLYFMFSTNLEIVSQLSKLSLSEFSGVYVSVYLKASPHEDGYDMMPLAWLHTFFLMEYMFEGCFKVKRVKRVNISVTHSLFLTHLQMSL